MNIFITGPTLSGKSTLAYALAAKFADDFLWYSVVDIGQIARITATEQDEEDIKSGKLVSRGDMGTNWVNNIVDSLINQTGNRIIVGYPRSDDQFKHISELLKTCKYNIAVIALLGSLNQALTRSKNRKRDDDLRFVIINKIRSFNAIYLENHATINTVLSSDGMTPADLAALAINQLDTIFS